MKTVHCWVLGMCYEGETYRSLKLTCAKSKCFFFVFVVTWAKFVSANCECGPLGLSARRSPRASVRLRIGQTTEQFLCLKILMCFLPTLDFLSLESFINLQIHHDRGKVLDSKNEASFTCNNKLSIMSSRFSLD